VRPVRSQRRQQVRRDRLEFGPQRRAIFHGAPAAIEAEDEFEHPADAHTIVVAHVTDLRAHEGRRPLLFYRGSHGGLA
jgi:3-hydroxy-9,10-secoandrosta-1,3,5(10)-triene-9,17-dione monooxygenase reductase component